MTSFSRSINFSGAVKSTKSFVQAQSIWNFPPFPSGVLMCEAQKTRKASFSGTYTASGAQTLPAFSLPTVTALASDQ